MSESFSWKLKRYMRRMDPKSRQFGLYPDIESNAKDNSTKTHIHIHQAYPDHSVYPWWWWWSTPTHHHTTVNYNFSDGKKDNDEKKDKKEGITANDVFSAIAVVGATTGVGYVIMNNFMDLREESDLYRELKQNEETLDNIVYKNAKVIVKHNLHYSKNMFLAKTIGLGAGLLALYDAIYWDNIPIFNGCILTITASTLMGIWIYLGHQRWMRDGSEGSISYDILHRNLTTVPTPATTPPPTAPDENTGYSYLD